MGETFHVCVYLINALFLGPRAGHDVRNLALLFFVLLFLEACGHYNGDEKADVLRPFFGSLGSLLSGALRTPLQVRAQRLVGLMLMHVFGPFNNRCRPVRPRVFTCQLTSCFSLHAGLC